MEGRLGRFLSVLNAPFRGESVDKHYLTTPFYQRGVLHGQRGLAGMQAVLDEALREESRTLAEAEILGFAKAAIERERVPSLENNPLSPERRTKSLFDHMMTELEERRERGERIIKEAKGVAAKVPKTLIAHSSREE